MRLDLGGKLAGRGAYLHPTQACLEGALRKHHIERALRRPLPLETIQAIAALASETPIGSQMPGTTPPDGSARSARPRPDDGLDDRFLNG